MGKSQECEATAMSTACAEFSENAWKKDLCKNCQRSRAEHNSSVRKSGTKDGGSSKIITQMPTRAKRTSISQTSDSQNSTTQSTVSTEKKHSPSPKGRLVQQHSEPQPAPTSNSQNASRSRSVLRSNSTEEKATTTKPSNVQEQTLAQREASPVKSDLTPKPKSRETTRVQMDPGSQKGKSPSREKTESSNKRKDSSTTINGMRQPDKLLNESTVTGKNSTNINDKSRAKIGNDHGTSVIDGSSSVLQPKSALKKSAKTSRVKSATVLFQEDDPQIIGYNGGEDNLPAEEKGELLPADSATPGDVEHSLTEEEKQFSLLSLENTRWNADVQNLKINSPLEEKMKRVASKEFEDVELESLWKPDRFPTRKDCDAGKIKTSTFPLTRKTPPRRASIEDIFGEASNEMMSSDSELVRVSQLATKSDLPEAYKTPIFSREISPCLDGGSLRSASSASSRASSVSDNDIPVEPFKVKKEKKPRVASAYKVIDINPEPVVKPYGIVDVSSGVPDSYPPPELPSTPAPTRSRRSSERTSPARSIASDTVSISSNCSSERDNVSESGTLGRGKGHDTVGESGTLGRDMAKKESSNMMTDSLQGEMSITLQMLNDHSNDAELKAAIKLLDEVWKQEEAENGKVVGGLDDTGEILPKMVLEPAPKPAKRVSVMTDSTTDIGSSGPTSPPINVIDDQSGQSVAMAICPDEVFQRSDPGRESKGKSHAFEAKMASIAANLDLNKQKGKRPAPQPPLSPPPDPPKEPVKSPNKVTSQTPDPTFRFVNFRPTSPTPVAYIPDEIPVSESEPPQMDSQDSPKISKANNEVRKSGLMSFFSKFLRRGKEDESNEDTITVTAMEDTIKFVDKNAILEESSSDEPDKESSTDDCIESEVKSPKPTHQTKIKVMASPSKTAGNSSADASSSSTNIPDNLKPQEATKNPKGLTTQNSNVIKSAKTDEVHRIPEIMSASMSALPSTIEHGILNHENPKPATVSPKRSGEGSNHREIKTVAEVGSGVSSKAGQKSPDVSAVRRRVRSPTKRDAPRPVTAPRALDGKNTLFAKELELRLSKGGMEAKPGLRTSKVVDAKKLPAPQPPMSPISPTPSAAELNLKKDGYAEDRPISMPPAPPGNTQDQELYLPPWESRVCEKIELPCQKGRRSILGRIGGPRKSRPPAPPPPGPTKATVKRAKSITESDGKKIGRSDISGPILIQGMTTTATTTTPAPKAINRRNTISLGDDSSYASGGSSSQDSGSGSIGSKKSSDDPPEPPSMSPLGSLENLYEPIGPRSQSMSTSLEGYLEPVCASSVESSGSSPQTAPVEVVAELPKKILSLSEERELFLASQPIYEEIPNDGDLYPDVNIALTKTIEPIEPYIPEMLEAQVQSQEKLVEKSPSQPSSREGTPKVAVRSQTLPRPAPRSKCGEKLSPDAATTSTFPLHIAKGPPPATGPPAATGPPPASGPVGSNRPKPVPRKKPQLLAKPVSAGKTTVDQYVAMNRPGCSAKNFSLESLRENFNKITGTNFESLQEILRETVSELLHNNPVVKGTLRWTHFRLCSDSPLFTSNRCVVYQATLPELKSDTTVFQLMIFPKSQQQHSQVLSQINWLNILAAFTDSVPVKFLSDGLLQVWKLPRETTNQEQGGRVKVHIVVTRYYTYEFLNDYFHALQETMQITSDGYYRHFVFVLVQCFRAFLFALERGYSLSNIGLQDINVVSSAGLSGKFISIWPKLRAHENSSPDDSICSNAKRIMQELILSFTCIEQKFPPRFEIAMDHVTELLQSEQSECLSVARAVLEFSLWGPEVNALESIMKSNAQEQAFDLWLEVERATLVNAFALLSMRKSDCKSVDDLYKMKFLLKSNGASMSDVAKQLWKR